MLWLLFVITDLESLYVKNVILIFINKYTEK
mgnify:FL=1